MKLLAPLKALRDAIKTNKEAWKRVEQKADEVHKEATELKVGPAQKAKKQDVHTGSNEAET